MIIALCLLVFAHPGVTQELAPEDAWQALAEGRALLLLRHALAPGIGDPAEFTLGECDTQRNLNQEGRRQAKSWQATLQGKGIDQARVFTSAWCRSRDTADLMDMGEVTEMAALNSFFNNRGDRQAQSRATLEQVNALPPGPPIILVSHQVNITALAGVYPASNQGVILALPLTENPTILADGVKPH
ncbi:MAG: histidine phosphatase family protein [Halomonadaceae bacterium]|nr:MAG: histidine phosphatase family protein [Halomonadaceae bacterium]